MVKGFSDNEVKNNTQNTQIKEKKGLAGFLPSFLISPEANLTRATGICIADQQRRTFRVHPHVLSKVFASRFFIVFRTALTVAIIA